MAYHSPAFTFRGESKGRHTKWDKVKDEELAGLYLQTNRNVTKVCIAMCIGRDAIINRLKYLKIWDPNRPNPKEQKKSLRKKLRKILGYNAAPYLNNRAKHLNNGKKGHVDAL